MWGDLSIGQLGMDRSNIPSPPDRGRIQLDEPTLLEKSFRIVSEERDLAVVDREREVGDSCESEGGLPGIRI